MPIMNHTAFITEQTHKYNVGNREMEYLMTEKYTENTQKYTEIHRKYTEIHRVHPNIAQFGMIMIMMMFIRIIIAPTTIRGYIHYITCRNSCNASQPASYLQAGLSARKLAVYGIMYCVAMIE